MKHSLASASLIPVMLVAACAPQSPAPSPPSTPLAACDNGNYDWLMGSDAGALPTGRLPDKRRVFDTTMKVTQDYVEGRLNVVYDAATGKIVRVYCG